VGTPGRLNDILSDQYSGIRAPKLTAFVLDEADRLLDQGFWAEIQNIQRELPDIKEVDRQTMMFSATVPQDVIQAVRSTLKPGFRFVKCVRDDEEPTHARVPQKVIQTEGLENVMPALLELCQREVVAQKEVGSPFKALVYFNSTAEVTMAAEVFQGIARSALPGTRIFEIHSKLTQQQRTAQSDNFRRSESAILFSSDVTSRGMDFPNVTHVIQVGCPKTREDYIHRIGRTGRAGKEGNGYLIVPPLDAAEIRYRLRNLPIKSDDTLLTDKIDMTREQPMPAGAASVLTSVTQAYRNVDRGTKAKVYQAYLGVYQWVRDKQQLIDAMQRLTKYGWGMESPPTISPALARRLGLDRLQGIALQERDSFGGREPSGGREAFGSSGRGGFGDRRGGGGFDRRGSSSGGGGMYSGGGRFRDAFEGSSDGPPPRTGRSEGFNRDRGASRTRRF